jgi:hypothetical protein
MLKNAACLVALLSAAATLSVACAATESAPPAIEDPAEANLTSKKTLSRFECPNSFSVKIADTEVKPLVSLKGNAAYQTAVAQLTKISATPLTLELKLASFQPSACRYASANGTLAGDALIFKRSEAQFTEDGTEFSEVITRLDLRYKSEDGAAAYRSVFEIVTKDAGTPTAIVENDADDRKGVLVSVDRAWRRIGSSVHTFQF